MLLHLRHTLRNLWFNRLYTAIHVSGLAVGMSAALLIGLWAQNEWRFDSFHRRAEYLWRVKSDIKIDDTQTWHWGATPYPLRTLSEQTPGIVGMVQSLHPKGRSAYLQRGGEIFEEKRFAFVDPGWFEMFDYEFLEGSAAGFGDRPNDLLLTERLAKRIFGSRSALGATLRMDSVEMVVHAVLRDPRPESSFNDNLLLPMEAWLRQGKNRRIAASWDNFNFDTFVELRQEAKPETVAAELTRQLTAAKQDSNIRLHLGRLTDLHFDLSLQTDHFDKGSRRTVGAFSLVGALILLMAAINYVSLTTARAQTRAREAGIRKVAGASYAHLLMQFLRESMVLISGAAILAWGLVCLSLPWFSEIADRPFQLQWNSPLPWLLFGTTFLITVGLSGIYPAIQMAGFKPAAVLRGSANALTSGGLRSRFRQVLVVLQCAIATGLLICTLIISRQRAFMAHKELGYERREIFTFNLPFGLYESLGQARGQQMQEALATTIRQSAAVAGLTRANESPVHIQGSHSGSLRFDGLPEDARPSVYTLNADAHFAGFFGLKLKEGRWFDVGNKADEKQYVLNETAARQLGLPQPWLGQRFSMYDSEGQVIGVLRDFHFLPLHEAIPPLVVMHEPNWRGYFFVKTYPGRSDEAIAAASQAWKQWFPDRPFTYSFLEDDYDHMYENERRAGILFNCFAGIAGFLACLGLFGLATYVALQRTKEIGVRKVLGASVTGIAVLLTFDFLKWVLFAFLLAMPPVLYLMQHWLSEFAYRIRLEWWMFAIAGLLVLTVAALTVGFQSLRVALTNPVKSLRRD